MNAPVDVSPTLADLKDAARQIAGAVVVTPLVENPALNERVGGRVLLKCETLQVAGAFKFRGAYNRISRLDKQERARGVVAYSSGNHAQGVAAAAKMVGARAVIVMPSDSPRVKVEGVRRYGGEVRLYDRWTESREAIGEEIARERGSVLVRPFDDPYVIAGQGTCGLELMRQAAELGATPDAVLSPASGGGLVAGVSIAVKALSPTTEVWGVEPELHDDTRRSFAAGEPVEAPRPDRPSICDALLTPVPGDLTFPINRKNLSGVLTVSDTEVVEAIRTAFSTCKLVVEPGGAAALAAVLAGKLPAAGRTVAVILSGGNVDPADYARYVAG
jgi:threonine dehydratase